MASLSSGLDDLTNRKEVVELANGQKRSIIQKEPILLDDI